MDFSYEVSRSLAACEGALLVVDATQGIEAQTLANLYLALEHDLEIIPVINKIDLPSADPEGVKRMLEDSIGLDASQAILASAKTGEGCEDILQAVVERIPPPKGEPDAPTRALIFDSQFDPYRGAIAYVRVVDGRLNVGSKIRMMSSGKEYEVTEMGIFRPHMVPVETLGAGEVGCVIAQVKNVKDTRVGDTITDANRPAEEPLPGYRPAQPMVFCGLYPVENDQYTDLRDALEKLQLNDASLVYEPESSTALGFGFRRFSGPVAHGNHPGAARTRIDLNLITTAPSVVYRVTKTDGTVLMIDNPSKYPPTANREGGGTAGPRQHPGTR